MRRRPPPDPLEQPALAVASLTGATTSGFTDAFLVVVTFAVVPAALTVVLMTPRQVETTP